MPVSKSFNYEKPIEGATNTWLTPPRLLEKLGPFDLDPCAAIGQPWKTATLQFTEKEDGLVTPWKPKSFVWCNPPYGKETYKWLAKMQRHANGIALVFARVETRGFFASGWQADGLLFLEGRMAFYDIHGKQSAGKPASSVLLAYGDLACYRLQNASLAGCYVFGKKCLTGDRI
ncbi:MAG: phage N-6-adenine-methyltransferase [Terrimicrobiaceae bacterium]|jgi:hypothetical protein|nr:phage N-6-adenine-methyltransferase [Terrimicrobiaceae bacterium]